MCPLGMPKDKKGPAKSATHVYTVRVATIIFHILGIWKESPGLTWSESAGRQFDYSVVWETLDVLHID